MKKYFLSIVSAMLLCLVFLYFAATNNYINFQFPQPIAQLALKWINYSGTDLFRANQIDEVRNVIANDMRNLTVRLELTSTQVNSISKQLEKFRLSQQISETTEYNIVTSNLTPKQITAYNDFLDQKKLSEINLLVDLRIQEIERTVGTLSNTQKEKFYSMFTESFTGTSPLSETDIISSVLNET